MSIEVCEETRDAEACRRAVSRSSKLKKRACMELLRHSRPGSDWSEVGSRKASTSAPKAKKSTGGVLSREQTGQGSRRGAEASRSAVEEDRAQDFKSIRVGATAPRRRRVSTSASGRRSRHRRARAARPRLAKCREKPPPSTCQAGEASQRRDAPKTATRLNARLWRWKIFCTTNQLRRSSLGGHSAERPHRQGGRRLVRSSASRRTH